MPSLCCCGRIPRGRRQARPGFPVRPTCNQAQCHVGTAVNGGGGSVKVTFPGGSTYAAGVKQHLVVTISDRATGRAWGFQLTARPSSDPKTQAGSFTSTDRFTAVVCNVPPFNEVQDAFLDFGSEPELSREQVAGLHRAHSSRQLTVAVRFSRPSSSTGHRRRAPRGNITIYVAGNAANGDTQPDRRPHLYGQLRR